MEYLTFNNAGQWTLNKSAKPPYSSPEGGISTPREQGEPNNDFRSYGSTTGQLHEDYGQRGSIHGAPGNKRAPKQGESKRNWGKPANLLPSAASYANPGVGI